MIKNRGCLIFLLIAASTLVGALILIGVFIFFIFWGINGEDTVKLPDNISPETAKVQSDPFYRNAGGWDYSRLPLTKPYELIACNKLLKGPVLLDKNNPISSRLCKPICEVKKFNMHKNYFIAFTKANGIGSTNLPKEGEFKSYGSYFLILNLKQKNTPILEIDRDYAWERVNYADRKIEIVTTPPYFISIAYGKSRTTEKYDKLMDFLDRARHFGFDTNGIINNYNKIEIRIPEEYYGCLFFNKVEFFAGLKKRGIPEDIKLFEPAYFYRKFLDEGQCPWFPKAKKENPHNDQK